MFAVKAKITTPDEFHSLDPSFYRTQTPLTLAFALSDYGVQSRGLKNFILDLDKPPTASLKIGNIYVMLSRVSSWNDVAILRPFNESIFHSAPDAALLAYDEYLEQQNEDTKKELEDVCKSFE